MKILITNHWLKKLGGSETFTYALAGALSRKGHRVELFTNIPGMVSHRISNDFNIPRITDPQTRTYDLVLANHNTCVNNIYPQKKGKIIQTCHGTVPKLEQPNDLADKHVAISEEVAEYLGSLGTHSTIIRNGVDCNRFKPINKLNKQVKVVLSLSHSDELNALLRSEFALYGIQVISFNKYKNPVWDVENYMNKADLVVSLGRGAYEAMACGRPVLVLDKRPYQAQMGDGLITHNNIDTAIRNNLSGRSFRNHDVKQMIEFALRHYSPGLGEWCRAYAEHQLNIDIQANKYLSLV